MACNCDDQPKQGAAPSPPVARMAVSPGDRCAVCWALDRIETPATEYCDFCHAHLCQRCSVDWARRARAAIKTRLTDAESPTP